MKQHYTTPHHSLSMVICNILILLTSSISIIRLILSLFNGQLTFFTPLQQGIGVIRPQLSPTYVIIELFLQFILVLGSCLYFLGAFKEAPKILGLQGLKLQLFKIYIIIGTITLLIEFYNAAIKGNYLVSYLTF